MVDPKPRENFDTRLAAAQERQRAKHRPRARAVSGTGAAVGLRIAVEITAAVGVGVVIGLALDDWLGTKPWLLIMFCVLGFGAALVNVMRTARELDRQRRETKQKQASPGDEAELN